MKEKILKCPKCSNFFNRYKLRKIKHSTGAILDVCDVCNGMWLDAQEVELLYKLNKRGNKK